MHKCPKIRSVMTRKLLPFLFLIPLATFAQRSTLKQPMFKDLRVVNTITKSYRDSTCVFHVAAIDDDVKPDITKRYFWYHQGEIKNTQGNFTGKLLHGTYEKFDRDGTLLEKGSFDNGVKDGEWFDWYSNGNMMRHYNWNNGQRVGRFEGYDNKGNKSVVGQFKNGALNGNIYYYQDGVETRKEKYRNGELVKAKEKKIRKIKKDKKIKKDSTQQSSNWLRKKKTPKEEIQPAPANVPNVQMMQPGVIEQPKSKERKKKRQPKENPSANP